MADLNEIAREFNAIHPAVSARLPGGAWIETESEWVNYDSGDAQFHDGLSGYTDVSAKYYDPRLTEEELERISISVIGYHMTMSIIK